MKDLLFNYWTMHSVIFLKTLYYNLELKITYVKYECVFFVKFILTKWYFYLCFTFGKSLKRLTAFLQSYFQWECLSQGKQMTADASKDVGKEEPFCSIDGSVATMEIKT